MKKVLVFVFAAFFAWTLNAQQETLISRKIESGGYGGFFTKFGSINGEFGVFMGGQGAWLINSKFGIGGGGYGMVNRIEIEDMENVKMEFGCGGARLEYIVNSDKLWHLNVHSMIGGGGVNYAVIDHDDPGQSYYGDDGFFVFEPGLDLVHNVTTGFRLAFGASYRVTAGVNYAELTNTDLNGFSGQILLKFGRF